MEDKTISKLFQEIYARKGQGSYRLTGRFSKDFPTIVESTRAEGRSLKETLVHLDVMFSLEVGDIFEESQLLGEIINQSDVLNGFDSVKELAVQLGISEENAKQFTGYLELSYGDFEVFLESLKKCSSQGSTKISKTYVVSDGLRKSLKKYKKMFGLSQSGCLEFLVRTSFVHLQNEEKNMARKLLDELEEDRDSLNKLSVLVSQKAEELQKILSTFECGGFELTNKVNKLVEQMDYISTSIDCEVGVLWDDIVTASRKVTHQNNV